MIGANQSDNPWDPPAAQAANPWSPEDDAAARAYFSNYLTGHADYGDVDDGLRAYQQQRQAGLGHDQAIAAAMSTLGWSTAAPGPGATSQPSRTVSTGGAPGPNVGGLVTPFGGSFAPPSPAPYPNMPEFHQPTMGEAANDPGYMFSLNQGKKNLESWLAAHGTFNDSSAAEALQQYGQGAAATQYGNVWNRAYQGWQGAIGPWQTQMSTTQHDNDMRWQEAFNTWLQNWNVFKDQRDSTFDKRFKVATA